MATSDDARRNGLTYAEAGVSIDAGDELVRRIGPEAARTNRPGVMGGIGGFGALFDLKAAGYDDPILVAATDGVGTKLRIGIETQRLRGLGQDLVAMCVNDLICQGAEPLFFLDYFATSKLNPEEGALLVAGVADACAGAGCALIGGETAEMPGLYAPGDFDLAGFAVGAAERGRLLPRAAEAGDVIIGVASDGLHSNGFSLVRRIAEASGADYAAAPPFAASESTLGEALLRPTRLYVKPALALLRDASVGPALSGFAHITGGGLTENLPRVLSAGLEARLDLAAWRPDPLFSWLARAGGVVETEMLRTFNCGVGFIVIVKPAAAETALARLTEHGEQAFAIGAVGASEDADAPPQVRYAAALAL